MSTQTRLSFEEPVHALEQQVSSLRSMQGTSKIDLQDEIDHLQAKLDVAWRSTYERLTPWQVAQVARHPRRPYTLDYLDALFMDFIELHGDRAFGDDASIVGGLARFEGRSMVVMGHQKGRDVRERTRRNFGMPRPEGYRKAMRLMSMADQFQLPLLTFVDTPGAFPGIDAEERGQSAAIGESIYRMSQLRVPTLSIVIGEGGSGGALAIATADRVCMLEHATYSVISPEGCASILWRDAQRAEAAACALGLTAQKLLAMGLIDAVITEPLGGAHRDHAKAAEYVGRAIREHMDALRSVDPAQRFRDRQRRLRHAGSAVTTRPEHGTPGRP